MQLLILSLLLASQLLFAEPEASPALEYPLSSCLSCGDALGEQTVTLTHANRDLKFCCIECVGPYAKSPQTYLSSLEEQVKASQRETYPLKTCLVSGEPLGSMGEPVELLYGNTLLRFCCAPCTEKFTKDPSQFLKKLKPE